ncbi:Cof-type HAD-IIB family hydrolase [Bacillus sp. DX1.1]|uniref:Cof-type HAD-IIB family hydrolase n=1 Tax=unclassified Bacillus (in: firmicutes) TaxID=185979 RepID=UPI00256FFAE6|nr:MULTISPECIES: Cof-type HAD-IIB family hydrolase [unclassified Bacillus (in: firmicutes)]MDM5155666.1 Cof-type HAD-IIB family hydrolase [Bacillus sp. DX1.1]WJE79971.1 Cof-type HAD-IIB family hydrolase [Bacillus sp. DX3.1]
MEKSIIFFDIDGTLLDHDKKIPTSTKEAIRLLKQDGHKVAIATGRAPFAFKEICEELDINSYISLNGQYVVLDGEVIYKNPLSIEELQTLTDFSASNHHPIVYMGHKDIKSSVAYHAHIEQSIAPLKLGFSHPSYDPEYFKNSEIYQSLLFCRSEEESTYINQFQNLNFVRWHEFSMDVMPKGGSKAIGIEKVIEKLGLTKENVYAFGDGLNDLEMLQYVGYGVAMGNAHDEVKKIAKHVTKDVGENGIAYGLELVGLLK